jgi:2-dehydropantoate 2-reductase
MSDLFHGKGTTMKTLFYGAGPLGSLYAHLLHQAGKDVTILARDERYNCIKEHGVVLVNEYSGKKEISKIRVVDTLAEEDAYDLVVVLIRKNKLLPIFQALSRNKHVRNILFMGNNALGFDEYLVHLPKEKALFGFPGAGGSIEGQIVHYIDSEKPDGKRIPIRIGEIDGEIRDRTKQVTSLFESSKVPVERVNDMDGWLKYHAALVIPIACILYRHDCDNCALAKDEESIRFFIRACREGGEVLRNLGYIKRQPFKFNLFYWMPEFITAKIFQGILNTKFAEIGFAMHAKAALDEMKALTKEFRILTDNTSVKTPNIDKLSSYIT